VFFLRRNFAILRQKIFISGLKPGEGTSKEMYEIAMQFAEQAFDGEYEAVVAVHTDKNHLLAEKKRFTYKSAYLYEQIRKMHELCGFPGTSSLATSVRSSIFPTGIRYSNSASSILPSLSRHRSTAFKFFRLSFF